MIQEAQYYSKRGNERVQCHLCPAQCRLKPKQYGICNCRFNDSGRLMTDNFGETVTIAIDPIEKKPLYHFHPGTEIVSIGPNGCNLSCRHCQNWQISQEKTATSYIAPEKLPEIAGRGESIGVAYTYTEPLIWFEYLLAAAPEIHRAGLVNVAVSNGYINLKPLEELLPLIDAFNIDLKGMRPEFYRRICKGRLEPVMDVIKAIAASPAHLEVTNLIIPGLNDSDDDFERLGEFLGSLDPAIPLHLSAYYPSYKLDQPPTPAETMIRAYKITKKYLSSVFVGNMYIKGCSDSICSSCGAVLVSRSGYRVDSYGLEKDGRCRNCGTVSGIITV